MGKFLLLATAFFCLFSCKKDKLPKGTPECIKEKISVFSQNENSKSVKRMLFQGENHYWFDDDAMNWDGCEYILNESCDTICFFCGEGISLPCTQDYNAVWETIWEK